MATAEVHTDGACLKNPGPGGYAAIILAPPGPSPTFETTVTGYRTRTTNNRMELTAVIEGLEAVKNAVLQGVLPPAQQVMVYSDSRYVVDAHNKFWIRNWQSNGWLNFNGNPVANPDLWERLIKLDQDLFVTYTWVKGHSGNKMNERCDRLAGKEARKAAKQAAQGRSATGSRT